MFKYSAYACACSCIISLSVSRNRRHVLYVLLECLGYTQLISDYRYTTIISKLFVFVLSVNSCLLKSLEMQIRDSLATLAAQGFTDLSQLRSLP